MSGRVSEGNGTVVPSVFGGLRPPDLPIINAHHLWTRPSCPCLVPAFAADLATGHKAVAKVYAGCGSFYRNSGPGHLKPVGETRLASMMHP